MIRPLLLGTVAALVVAVPSRFAYWLEGSNLSFSLRAPVLILGVTVLAMLFQRFILDRREGPRGHQGIADFFVHIHSFGAADPAVRWVIRGINSLLLSFFGGIVGPEGAAAELAQATGIEVRDRSSRFSEQRRRVDASSALAGAIAAAFGAPFAAVLVPVELGLGGPVIRPVVAAIAAFLVSDWIGTPAILDGLPGVREAIETGHVGPAAWIAICAIALMLAPAGYLFVRLTVYIGYLLGDLFRRQPWMRILLAGGLLAILALIFPAGHQQPWKILETVLWGGFTGPPILVLLAVEVAMLALVLAGFGSVGVFWPLLALGATFGVVMNQWIFQGLPGFGPLAAIAGASAAWGAVLGTPLAAAVLVFELTQSVPALGVALLSAVLARSAFRFIGVPGMIALDLEARGMKLVDGRSFDILDAIPVREAMVADFETVHEHEPVSELHLKLLKSRYPFIPVVTAQGVFRGLLTVDMIEEAWRSQQGVQVREKSASLRVPADPALKARKLSEDFSREISDDISREMMMRLLEAKDLLYRSGLKYPTVRLTERLSAIGGKFDESPCVAVVTEDGRVAGLLFVHHVRLAYDRELARRALVAGTGVSLSKDSGSL